MKYKLALLLALCALQSALCNNNSRKCHVTYEVSLPTSVEPVIYDIDIVSQDAADDPYSESYYLIDWTLHRSGEDSHGFSAYLPGGHHYRYKEGTPMQEYHASADPAPFLTDDGGVARRAQFYDLLPASVRAKINEIKTDSAYIWEERKLAGNSTLISGTQRVHGYDAMEFTYRLQNDKDLYIPTSFEITYNPAAISEQIVNVEYDLNRSVSTTFTEEWLVAQYPQAFENYRQDNFRAENLRGNQAPSFAYTTPNGRISHNRGEIDLKSPLILAFLDADVAGIADTANTLRNAANSAGRPVSLVLAFKNDNPDDIPTPSDYIAISPGRLIRDCGITSYPTILLIDTSGTIADIILTLSNDDIDTLAQQLAILP